MREDPARGRHQAGLSGEGRQRHGQAVAGGGDAERLVKGSSECGRLREEEGRWPTWPHAAHFQRRSQEGQSSLDDCVELGVLVSGFGVLSLGSRGREHAQRLSARRRLLSSVSLYVVGMDFTSFWGTGIASILARSVCSVMALSAESGRCSRLRLKRSLLDTWSYTNRVSLFGGWSGAMLRRTSSAA